MSIFDTLKGIFVTPGADDYIEDEYENDDNYQYNKNQNGQNGQGRSNGNRQRNNRQDDDYVYGSTIVDSPDMPSSHSHRPSPRNNAKAQQSEVIVIHPKDMEAAYHIGANVRQGRLVIVDLTGLNADMARRIVDYLSGVCHTIEGQTMRINNGIFTISPPTYSVKEETSRLSSNNHENEFGPTSPSYR
jgi:cell division inhibitor SepF